LSADRIAYFHTSRAGDGARDAIQDEHSQPYRLCADDA
jgi:hypothetical protein